MARCLVRRGDQIIDVRNEMVRLRRQLYNDLMLRLQLQRTTHGESDSAFVDCQAFYNQMSMAIYAFEEAFASTRY